MAEQQEFPLGESPLASCQQRGLLRPISGRAPPEGALDLRVRAGQPRVGAGAGAGAGGLGSAGLCAGDHGKKGERACIPGSQPGVRFSNDLARSN